MATFSLTLTLQNAKNTPRPNLIVRVFFSAAQKGEARTDAEGRCTIAIEIPDVTDKKNPQLATVEVFAGSRRLYGGDAGTPTYTVSAASMNVTLTIKKSRAEVLPITYADLRLRPDEILASDKSAFVAGKLNAALKEVVLQSLPPATRQNADPNIVFDYTQVKNLTLGAAITRYVPTTRSSEDGTPPPPADERSVQEVLHLDQPLSKNPYFFEETQVLTTTTLVYAIASQNKEYADVLLDRGWDWERASQQDWDAAAAAAQMNDTQKALLQRGFALSRLSGKLPTLVAKILPDVPEISQVAAFDEAYYLKKIKEAGNLTPYGESPETYAAQLVQVAQRNFPSRFFLERKVWTPLDKEQLVKTYRYFEGSTAEQLKKRQDDMRQFLANNPGFDLLKSNLFKKDENGAPAFNYTGIDEAQQANVRKQFMAMQRVSMLSPDYAVQETLLSNGLDSAAAIIQHGAAALTDTLADALSANAVFQQAQNQMQTITLASIGLQEIVAAPAIGFSVGNYPPELVNQLQDIDGYSDMFGAQDYCECEHCKSIFGPAAYFVDLMKFVEGNVTFEEDGYGQSPANNITLQHRRPDLRHLELSCENTNAVVPYLQIVNEIQERYIAEVMGHILNQPPAGIDVWAQFARVPAGGDAGSGFLLSVQAANTWKNSFRLAYNRPFEESRILLEYFKTDYADILRALRVAAQFRMEQAYLGISAEEWLFISTPDTNMEDLRKLRFGFPDDRKPDLDVDILLDPGFDLKECPADVFLRATGLSRADAVYLASTECSLNNVTKTLRWNSKDNEETKEVKEWLTGLDDAVVLDYIHRLLRLQRHLPWTLLELDLVVKQSGDPAVTNSGVLGVANLERIARIREIQRRFDLSVEEALALHSEIPNESLHTRSIHNALLNSSVETAVPGMLARMFDAANMPQKAASPVATEFTDFRKWPDQLKGLGTTEKAFGQTYTALFGAAAQTIPNVSAAYRIVRLSALLGVSLEEFGYLLEWAQMPLFTINAGRIIRWMDVQNIVKEGPLSLSEIRFIVRGEESSALKFKYKGDTERDKTAKDKALIWTKAFTADKRLFEPAPAMEKMVLIQAAFHEHLGLLFNLDKNMIEHVAVWYKNFDKVWIEAQSNIGRKESGFVLTEFLAFMPVMERLMLFFEKMAFDADDLALFGSSTEFIQGTGQDALEKMATPEDMRRFFTYVRFKKRAGASGLAAFRKLLALDKTKWVSQQTQTLAGLLDTEVNRVLALAKVVSASQSAPELLRQYEDLIQLSLDLGTYDAVALNALRMNTYADALTYETALRTAFKARFSREADYEKTWEPYENRIQEQRRDVLCAFLLAMDHQNNFRDTGDLYAYFLVDVEMSGCARVSRILAATLSLQLYVHNVLMGLEKMKADPTHTFKSLRATLGKTEEEQRSLRMQWEWRKNYRVWEANRKVFLYPENWIEPELRDDKSPLFKALEEELSQQKITLEAAEAAYVQYLKGFAEQGQLIIAGACFEPGEKIDTYHIFGRTSTDPYQYYYRKMRVLPKDDHNVRAKQWTPWEKVELAINAPYVSPIKFKGKLYLFWVSVVTMEKNKFEGGGSIFEEFAHTITLNYSYLTENRKWLQPQKVKGFCDPIQGGSIGDNDPINLRKFESSNTRYRIFPQYDNTLDLLSVDYLKFNEAQNLYIKNSISILNNVSDYNSYLTPEIPTNKALSIFNYTSNNVVEHGLSLAIASSKAAHVEAFPLSQKIPGFILIEGCSTKVRDRELRVIFNNPGDYVFKNNAHQFILRQTNSNETVKGIQIYTPVEGRRETIMLTTTVVDDLSVRLSNEGLSDFLNLNTQELIKEKEHRLSFPDSDKLAPPFIETQHLDFSGAHGLYFRELFFHIPYLIADRLNAEGKYKEADYWFRKIFDPTAPYEPTIPGDRYWRFLEFRNHTLDKLIESLTNRAELDAYENNPFNPHAIARLRKTAYMKNIVMKYVDNLLDWGDSLFRRDTWESNTEAMMLYQLANNILGKRPQVTGPCKSAIETRNCGCPDPKTTYAKLSSNSLPPFLYNVENWVITVSLPAVPETPDPILGSGLTGYEDLANDTYNASSQRRGPTRPYIIQTSALKPSYAANLGLQLTRQNVFCIPHNENMLAYWDRVEDRLFKLRNCMNIDGVKRSLALFQPPIDPALLVAAFAAGLSVEDVLNSLYGQLPAYRFTYLLEKARAYAGTVQSFGGALLSALEKKDGEQLTLLRSTQEQNILKLTREIKKKAIEEAKANLQASVEGMANVVNRIDQYREWIEENLNGWERTQQVALHTSSTLSAVEPVYNLIASIVSLFPNPGAFTAMTYGGEQLERGSKNMALLIRSLSTIASIVSSSAGLEASFQRRAQGWKFDLKTAEQELKQAQQGIIAATIRLAMAQKDLEIHEKQIEQAQELHDFYKNKFSNLDLYKFMSGRLQKLHRMAYNLASNMAKQAEAAYRFETGDDLYFDISGGTFWDASRVGLLSGEQLTIELQKLETKYMDWNVRQMEIRQSFSLAMLDPKQLLDLQNTGTCTFKIPEWAFDLQYQGYYRRRIVSVQITIPCIAGPYTNVAATLTMLKGSLRKEPSNPSVAAAVFPYKGSDMVATSNAQNDGGQFDLNFRDERYLPFEGAGAVDSEWELKLPDKFRSFDYSTIADVVFHISYRAKYDGGLFKTNIKDGLLGKMVSLNKLLSLKPEFPSEFYQLSQPAVPTNKIVIVLTRVHFPYFANAFHIKIVSITDKSGQFSTISWDTSDPSICKIEITHDAQATKDVPLMLAFELYDPEGDEPEFQS